MPRNKAAALAPAAAPCGLRHHRAGAGSVS